MPNTELNDGPDTALARLLAASGRVQVVDLRAALDQARLSRQTGGPALADIIIQRGLISLAELEATYLSALRRPDGSVTPASGDLEDPAPTLGRYVILDELGRGGMGVVLKAFDPSAGEVVAIKKILGAVGPDELLRFEREAQIMNRLEHPGIATLREVVGSGPGAPYLVLDFVEGETLRARTQRDPLPPLEAAETLLGITRAISAAQEQGIVHRDLKPDNVMLTRDGPVVLDFGLARRVIDESVPATLSGEVLGTPCYMAPEQARAGHSDARTDVYGLGAILYECLTGAPPFNGTFVEVMRAVCERAPDPPTRRAPGTPAVLEAICLRCLQKAPAKRYPSADALARDLETFLATAQANSALGRVVAPATPTAKTERSLLLIGVGTFAALLAVVLTIGLVLLKPKAAPTAPVVAASPSLPPPPQAKPLEAAQARQRALNRAASDLRAGVPTPTIVAALAAALDRPPAASASVLTRAALVCLNAGANEQAEAYFARAIEQDARQLLPLYWLDVLRHPTCGPLATTLQERAEAAGGLNHPLALLARARLANGANDPAQALLLADRALAYRPQLAPALRERAQAHLAQGDAQAALVDFNRSYEQTPAWVTLLRIGRIQVDLLQILDAHQTLARLLRRRPDDVVCLTQRGRARLHAKRYLEARRDLDRAITLGVNHPERYRAFEARGELHTEQGRTIDASADYRKTLQLAPPDAHPERGRAEFGLGNLTKAEQHFTALIRSGSPLTFAGHRGRAKTRQRLGRLPEARRDLDAWIRLQPKDATAYLQRAHLLLILKDYPAAKADLDRVIRLRPDQPEGFFFRGVWHGETGDAAAADADWRRAWRLAPAGSRLRGAIRRARPGLVR